MILASEVNKEAQRFVTEVENSPKQELWVDIKVVCKNISDYK